MASCLLIPLAIKKYNLSINKMLNLGGILYGMLFLFYGPASFLPIKNSVFLVTILKLINGFSSGLIFPLSMPQFFKIF